MKCDRCMGWSHPSLLAAPTAAHSYQKMNSLNTVLSVNIEDSIHEGSVHLTNTPIRLNKLGASLVSFSKDAGYTLVVLHIQRLSLP